MNNKISMTGCTFRNVGTVARVSEQTDVEMVATLVTNAGKIIDVVERKSIAKQLGLEDLPEAELKQFLKFLKETSSPDQAAERSGLGKWLSERNIALASFAVAVIGLLH